jgi:hypothetical protein
MYIYIHVYVYINIYIYTYIYINIYIYIYIYINIIVQPGTRGDCGDSTTTIAVCPGLIYIYTYVCKYTYI